MRKIRQSTIIDVAKSAKTSKSTVSRYINGISVKSETKDAIDLAIRELNFHPNSNAQRLVSNRSQLIGIVVDDISNIFYAEILSGIETVLNNKGYRCTYYSRTSNYQGHFGFVDLANKNEVDGLILISFLKRSQKMINELKKISIPVVLIGDNNRESDIFSVDVNNEVGIREMVAHLSESGHTKIGFINGPEYFSASYWRKRGYISEMKDLGLEIQQNYKTESDWSKSGGYNAMEILLTGSNVTAVICANDEMAIGAIRCVNDLGYDVPNDISVVGFDDIEVAKWISPSLTTVSQPLLEMGEKVALGLLSKFECNHRDLNKRILINPKLVVRQSSSNIHNIGGKFDVQK